MVLASRGARNLDGGEEKINDGVLAAELRLIARGIHIHAVLAAAVLTLFCFYF